MHALTQYHAWHPFLPLFHIVGITPSPAAKPFVKASAFPQISIHPESGNRLWPICRWRAVYIVSGTPSARNYLQPVLQVHLTEDSLTWTHPARLNLQPSYMSRSSFDKTSGRSMRTL